MIDCIIGIDPGKAGGIAFMRLDGSESNAIKMPETETEVYHELRALKERGNAVCYLEQVQAIPRIAKDGKRVSMGNSTMFTFGKGYGILIGILTALEIRRERVRPQKWQKALSCLTGGNKNISKTKAQELFPELRVTHAIADALLICEYGRRIETYDITHLDR